MSQTAIHPAGQHQDPSWVASLSVIGIESEAAAAELAELLNNAFMDIPEAADFGASTRVRPHPPSNACWAIHVSVFAFADEESGQAFLRLLLKAFHDLPESQGLSTARSCEEEYLD